MNVEVTCMRADDDTGGIVFYYYRLAEPWGSRNTFFY